MMSIGLGPTDQQRIVPNTLYFFQQLTIGSPCPTTIRPEDEETAANIIIIITVYYLHAVVAGFFSVNSSYLASILLLYMVPKRNKNMKKTLK